MKKKRYLKIEGFSLAEAIIAISISILLLFVLTFLYIKYSNFYYYEQKEIEIGNSARDAMKQLQNWALQANRIASSHNFGGATYITDEDTLVLEAPSIDGSGNAISGTYDYVAFYVSGSNFYKRVDANAASSRSSGQDQISSAVSRITFIYNNSNLALATKIDIDIEMEKTYSGKTIDYNLRQSIYLRNL